MKISLLAVLCFVVLLGFLVQALAAGISREAERCTSHVMAMMHGQTRISVRQRKLLLHLMQERESDADPFAMYTWYGDKHTMASVLEYGGETFSNFALLVTFSDFLKIS